MILGFTGDMLVGELKPDHVRTYIAALGDWHNERRGHLYIMRKHYAVIRAWIRWLYAQKMITERISGFVKPPRLTAFYTSDLIRGLTYC